MNIFCHMSENENSNGFWDADWHQFNYVGFLTIKYVIKKTEDNWVIIDQ